MKEIGRACESFGFVSSFLSEPSIGLEYLSVGCLRGPFAAGLCFDEQAWQVAQAF